MSLFASAETKTSYRFILVGNAGSGKSATGNFILNREAFLSKAGFDSVTREIYVRESSAVLRGTKIVVVDTPGLFNLKLSLIQTALTIQGSLRFVTPGPHAFLIVLRPDRFTYESEKTLQTLMIMFGPKCMDHAIIIFTHLDQTQDFSAFLQESEENEKMKLLFDKCGRRIITINNLEKNKEIMQRKREKLMLMVGELSDNGRRYYQDDISIYRVCLEKLKEEGSDTRWDFSKIQMMLQEQQEDGMRMEQERQEQLYKMENKIKDEIVRLERNIEAEIKRVEETARIREGADRRERERLTMKSRKTELKAKDERGKWKAVASTFLHVAGDWFFKGTAAIFEAAASLVSGSTKPIDSDDSQKGSRLEDEGKSKGENNGSDWTENSGHGMWEEISEPDLKRSRLEGTGKTKDEDNGSVRMEESGHERLEEMSEPVDADRATRAGFETNLNKLILHLQSSLQRKFKEKRTECILRWKERVYPETILQAVMEIANAKNDSNSEECFQKANATVEMIEKFPEKELPDKQELLAYIYSYFGPTFAETGDFSKAIGYHEKDWIIAVEKLLKTLPEEKYPYEAALLYLEITGHYFTLWESFKSRSLSAARKAKDQELQLYGTVLFVLVEWMASNMDINPAKQRDYFCRVAFSMERSLQLAQYLDDKVATKAIQTILHEVGIRCKRPYLQEIDLWIRRKPSKPTKYLWIHNKQVQPLDPEIEHTEETESSASRLYGSSSHPFDVRSAISCGDVICVQQYLDNRNWEHEDELIDCFNYSLAFRDSDGNQTVAKVFLSWICDELAKLHQPCNVSVWAASIAGEYSSNEHLVLVCNYWDGVEEKFTDNCFVGLPVIYQEYNTVNEEELSVQRSKMFLETALSPIDAIQANKIISLNTDWLMKKYSNLEVIKPCPVRSACLEIQKETCIVLYCRMKGFIPFGEIPFPKILSAGKKSFPVDVREGFYVPAMFHENADVVDAEGSWDSQLFRMGFSMGPYDKEISATVGPFVQMEGNTVGFLTCAHAFGVPCNIKTVLRTAVVQPAKGEFASVNPADVDESICGYVDRITFDIDPNHHVNVDAALIRLKPEKVPQIGRFTWMNPRSLEAAGLRTGQSLRFDHGEIMRKETLQQALSNPGKIIKFGAVSGVTSSNLFNHGRVVIRIRTAELLHEHGDMFLPIHEGTRCYVMRGQYLVPSRHDSVFLHRGDSGSGVFYMDESQRLRCIGIAIGFLANSFEAVVTPIEDVLEALGLDESALMRFPVH